MLRRLGIRAKVLAVLAVPVLVLLLAATYIAQQSVGQARTAGTVSEVVAILPQYARTAEALQQERSLSVQQVGGDAPGDDLTVSRSATDDAVAALDVALRAVDLSGLDARVAAAVQDATNAHTNLVEIRGSVDAGSIPSSLVDSNYTDIITADNDVPVVVAETLSERSLASRLSAYGAIADTIEQVLRAQPTAAAVLADGGADTAQVRELASLFAVQNQARDDARAMTNTLRLPGIQLTSRGADLTAMQLSLTSGNELTVSALDPTRWNTLVDAELAALRPVANDLLASASDRAEAVAAQARNEALVTVGVTLAAAALSVLIALVVSQGIVVPMRRLTTAAGQVREELPRLVEQVAVPGESPDLTLADIPVVSRDEVGRLAQAFNDVNATTIQVAREQAALRGSIAEMFVNVARRDQVLLGRQLAFIDSLERSEEDPTALANLFRLDHLATRMRRNAESLLVLAGIDSGRRLRDAMPLSDVVRTASSEIEQYDRVQLELGADPLMHGFNALAAAHLLAELLENATLFSEPGTPVVVATDVDGDHVVVRVTDQGLGMTPDELTQANATIGTTSPTEALGAQRLGLYVVARLAHRLGARVRLEGARGDAGVSGTVAVVSFPVALFTAHDPALAHGLDPQRAPATGAVPVAEVPAAVQVDLAALTDGSTATGLPRRRVAAAPVTPVGGDQDVVLPAPAEATLAPEVAAEAAGWTPLVAPPAAGPAALPSRGTPPGWTPAARTDGDPSPAAPAAPRAGLFAGFRGRDAAPAGAPQDAADPAGLPDAGIWSGSPADALTAEPSAAEPFGLEPPRPALPGPALSGPALSGSAAFTAGLVDPADAGPAVAPLPEPEPLVVPGLVPDEPLHEPHAWAAWGDPGPTDPAPAEPVDVGPVELGPVDAGPVDAGPVDVGPVDAGPVDAGPVDVGPVDAAAFLAEPVRADVPAWSGVRGFVLDDQPSPADDVTQLLPPVPEVLVEHEAAPVELPAAEVPAPFAGLDAPSAAAWAPETPPAPAALPQRTSAWSPAPPADIAAPGVAAPDIAAPGVAAPAGAPVEATVPALPAQAEAPEAVALPDFASVLHGDPQDAAPDEPAHRPRPRRSFFSFRRSRATVPEPVATPPAQPVLPAAADQSAHTDAPTPVWASTATSPDRPLTDGPLDGVPLDGVPLDGLPLDPGVVPSPEPPAPSTQPAADGWSPSTGWSPLDPAGDAVAPSGWASAVGLGSTGLDAAGAPAAPPSGLPPFEPAPFERAGVEPAPFEPAGFAPDPFAPADAAGTVPAPLDGAALPPAAGATPPALAAAQDAAEPVLSSAAWPVAAPTFPDGPPTEWPEPVSGPPVLPGVGYAPGVAADASAHLVDPDAAPWTVTPDADVVAGAAPLPTRTRGDVPPPVPEPTGASTTERRPPRDISAWASSWSPDGASGQAAFPAWPTQPVGADPQPAEQPPGVPGQHGRPEDGRPGGMDAAAAAMLARRADIQEQALSELSQLSAYRPKVDARPAGGSGSLTRRVPTAIPAAPELSEPESGGSAPRDADVLRDRLSSFQSATRRGRRALAGTATPDGDEYQPGEPGPQAHEQPDQHQPSSSW